MKHFRLTAVLLAFMAVYATGPVCADDAPRGRILRLGRLDILAIKSPPIRQLQRVELDHFIWGDPEE